jgi:CrcB protein
MFWLYLCVFGACGVVLRHLLAQVGSFNGWPLGTFLANMLGCLAVGILVTQSSLFGRELAEPVKMALLIGLLGGLTTFSTLSFEVFRMFSEGKIGLAAVYWLGSNGLGFALCWLGVSLGRNFVS